MQMRAQSRKISIASYCGSRCFAPRVRLALKGLGYNLIAAATRGLFGDPSWTPDLRIVDERHLDRIPGPKEDPRTPVILLTGPRPLACNDTRVIGTVQRPAELTPLYRLIQEQMEEHPRRTPRVRTQLSARCIHADHRVVGAVVSLSENGCLFRASEDLVEGMRMNLQFAIPTAGVVSTRAECVRQEQNGVGLVFTDTPTETRHSINDFVCHRLATA
jgi:hypothetical protein